MAQSASVDPLHIGNIRLGSDSFIIKYDKSKADQTGARLSEKNIYANPFDWKQCYWTGLGIWIASRGEHEMKDNPKFFLSKKVKSGAASQKYCEQLLAIAQRHEEELRTHMLNDKFGPYGTGKGSATYATSGTTMSPSIPSIARRGEWSIGKVLDCYWHFDKTGDQFLGRVLSGLSPNSPQFDVLPPHWNLVDAMSNPDIVEAMEKTGMLAFNEGIVSDHRGLFCDLDQFRLLQGGDTSNRRKTSKETKHQAQENSESIQKQRFKRI